MWMVARYVVRRRCLFHNTMTARTSFICGIACGSVGLVLGAVVTGYVALWRAMR